MRKRVWVGASGLTVIAIVVFVITLTPTPVDAGYSDEIKQLLAFLHSHGVPTWFGYRKLEFSANVVMFAPLGFFLGLLLSRRWWIAVLALPVLSVLIECAQYLFLPGRFATVTDVIANSIGAGLGAMLAASALYTVHDCRQTGTGNVERVTLTESRNTSGVLD